MKYTVVAIGPGKINNEKLTVSNHFSLLTRETEVHRHESIE